MTTLTSTIEAAIVAQLESDITDLPIRAFPDKPADFKKLPFTKGLILVAYRGSHFSEPTNRDALIQERLLDFGITLQIRDLRGHTGAFAYLEAIRSSLSGFGPLYDKRAMYLTAEEFLDFDANIWTWGQTWHLPARQA